MTDLIARISSNKRIIKIISDYLQLNNISDLCIFDICENSMDLVISYNDKQKRYFFPVRIGAILDQVNIYNNSNCRGSVIYFVSGYLDVNVGVFVKSNGNQIFLTEKEISLINFLHENNGRVIAREELLESVWGYVDNVETHTLETHIYRLRQKIEDNPSEPNIVINDGDGYKICYVQSLNKS